MVIFSYKVESMMEEIREMKALNLYSERELRSILKKWQDFALHINGAQNKVQCFKKFITHEKRLVMQIGNRRNIPDERKANIIHTILNRTKNLYETVLQAFPHEFQMYLSYIDFCSQSKFPLSAPVVIDNMIKNCGENPEAWVFTSNWYAKDQNNLDEAFRFLNKGLTSYKDAGLYKQAIELTLFGITVKSVDNKWIVEKLKTYVILSCDHVRNSDYLIDVLNLLKPFSFTDIENYIITELQRSYPEVAVVWHTLAQRERKGSEEEYWMLCFSKYREGLTRVHNGEKVKLWSMYLDCLMEAEHTKDHQLQAKTNQLLRTELQKASQEKYLSEKYYYKWFELVKDNTYMLLHVLKEGTHYCPQSTKLWTLYLEHIALTGQNTDVDLVFEEGIRMLDERSLPLWLMYLRYYSLLCNEQIVNTTYQRGVQQSHKISNALKPKYLQWLYITYDIHDARKAYKILAIQKPYCKELHLVMSKLECAEMEYDYDEWEGVHKVACEQFGIEDTDIWINYMVFHNRFKKSHDSADIISNIYHDALIKLPMFRHSELKEKMEKALRN